MVKIIKAIKAITDIKPNKDTSIHIRANAKYGNVALGVQVKERGQWIKFRFGYPAEEQHPLVKITQTGKEPVYVAYMACRDYCKKMQAEGKSPREGQFGSLPSRYYLANLTDLINASRVLEGAS